jgi:hypothetical protein
MLTETEVRDLLARAAATIEVPPRAPITPAAYRRRRWLAPVLAGAASVLLVVGGIALVGDGGTQGNVSAPDPATTRNEPSGAGIPSVFGYDADSAEQLLTSAGLVVTRKPSYTCLTSDRAVRTSPPAGDAYQGGASVTLLVSEQPSAARCAVPPLDALAWQLLDFANGRGPAPAFASEVTVYVDGQRTVLTGEEAVNPRTWSTGSALGLLAAASRQKELREGFTATPVLRVHTDDGTQFACGGQELPPELSDRQSLWFSIEIPTDGPSLSCTFANVFLDEGQVDTLVVRTSAPLTGGAGTQPEQPGEPDPDSAEIVARFLAYGSGGPADLPAAVPVRLYLGNMYQKTIRPGRLEDRRSWDVCATYAERSCPLSAVRTMEELRSQPAITSFLPDVCLDTLTDAPPDTGDDRMVVLGPPEPESCASDFAVQIWYNDAAQITAVNLLFGSP